MWNLFGSRKPKGLRDLSVTDLENSKIRLSEEERRVYLQIERKEKDKETLFAQGVETASHYQKLALARRVREVDGEIKDLSVRIARISQRLRVVDKVIDLKKTEAKNSVQDPVWNAITALSPEDLEKIITSDQAAIIAEDRKLGHILEILDVDSSEFALEEDPETMRILKEMENAGETSSIGKDLDAVQSRLLLGSRENDQEAPS
jgi:hypothetical protein